MANPTGFTFGQQTTTGGFSFGSSLFGTSTGFKPSFGTVTNTNTAPVTSTSAFGFGSLITPAATTVASNQPTFGITPAAPSGTQGTPSLPSFGNLAKPATTVGLGLTPVATVGAFGTGLGTPVSTPLNFGQLNALTSSSVLPASNLFKPTATSNTSISGSPFSSLGVTTTVTSAQPVSTPVLPSFGTLGTTVTGTATPFSLASTVTTSAPTTGLGTSVAVTSAATPGTLLGKLDSNALTKTTALGSPLSFGLPTTSVSISSTTASGFSHVQTAVTTSAVSATTTSAVSTVSTLNTTATPSTSQTLTYNQLEELINKWTHELEEQERYFLDEADRINQWDQALINNAENITSIYEKVDNCQNEQMRLEQELDFIEGQQRELENLLEPLERTADELPPGQLHSDYEREAIFQLATNVDLELGQLLTDLREIADQTNATTMRLANSNSAPKSSETQRSVNKALPNEGADVMQQITRILNCHMHSLNWIHHSTQDIMDRLKLLNTS